MKNVYKEYIFVTVTIMYRIFLIVSLYGPSRDGPEFYAELEERINDVVLKTFLLDVIGI